MGVPPPRPWKIPVNNSKKCDPFPYKMIYLFRNSSCEDIKKILAKTHQTPTLVSDFKTAVIEESFTEEENINTVSQEPNERDVELFSSSDEEDVLEVKKIAFEKRKMKKLLKRYPNLSKEEVLAVLKGKIGEESIEKWQTLLNTLFMMRNVQRMFICWKSKTVNDNSNLTSFMKRKLYHKKMREGLDLNEINLCRMSWKEFPLSSEMKIYLKDLMKQAAVKTKLMVKTVEAHSDNIDTLKERNKHERLNRLNNEDLIRTKPQIHQKCSPTLEYYKIGCTKPHIVNREEVVGTGTCYEVEKILHTNRFVMKKIWNKKTNQYQVLQ